MKRDLVKTPLLDRPVTYLDAFIIFVIGFSFSVYVLGHMEAFAVLFMTFSGVAVTFAAVNKKFQEFTNRESELHDVLANQNVAKPE